MDFALADDDEPEADATLFSGRQYGHFEVVVGKDGLPLELGAGAMAVTYRARDTVLGCPVALKVISRDLAEHPAARARFLREAQAAARLRHPNVASVTHYGEQDGECFYAMELVEGETLETTVRRDGPLSAAAALEIVAQVARALTAAEACGVVHCDLKPSNLMLVAPLDGVGVREAPAVKVIDWGLAKAVTADTAMEPDRAHSGFLGTPAFASPEQFARQEDLPIDTRADIYSLGVTLWYLLCGQTPYSGRTLEEIHHRQTHQPLPRAQLAAARVPRPLAKLLAAMLAPDPARRPPSARRLLEAVDKVRERLLRPGRTRVWLPARRWWLLLPAAGAWLAAGAILWWQFGQGPAPHAADPTVAVLPFENLSPDPAEAFYADGVQGQVVAGLARVTCWTIIGAGDSRFYPAANRDLAKIGQELGAAYLLEGRVRRADGQAWVEAALVDLRDPAHPWKQVYQRELAGVINLPGEIARAVAEHLHVPLSADVRTALDTPPTRQVAAYDLYLRARENPEIPDEEAQRRVLHGEVALLDNAVAADLGFAQAYCALAEAHDRLGALCTTGAEENPDDHRAAAETALAQARRLRPDAGELHLALAVHLLETDQPDDRARREIDLARQALPNSAEVETVAGEIARRHARWEDAMRALQRALALEPHRSANLLALADTYRLLRRYDDFDLTMHRLIDQAPAQHEFAYRLYRSLGPLENRADLAPLRAALAVTPDDDPDKRRYELILALCARDVRALSGLAAGANPSGWRINGMTFPKAWFEALAAQMRGDSSGAQAALVATHTGMEKTVAAMRPDGRSAGFLAVVDALLGRRDQAASASNAAPGVAASDLALVYAWTDQPDLAIAELRKCVGQPAGLSLLAQPTYGDLRLNPLWNPLRQDPRFAELVAQLAPTNSR